MRQSTGERSRALFVPDIRKEHPGHGSETTQHWFTAEWGHTISVDCPRNGGYRGIGPSVASVSEQTLTLSASCCNSYATSYVHNRCTGGHIYFDPSFAHCHGYSSPAYAGTHTTYSDLCFTNRNAFASDAHPRAADSHA